jgi:hypothetical protein
MGAYLGVVHENAVDGAIARMARRQHGVVARWQLDQLGIGRGAIRHRLEVGRLHRIYRGVYAVGHTALTRRGRWMAAVLALGPRALLSYRCAGALWEIRPSRGQLIDVTVPGGGRRRRQDIVIHDVRGLDAGDRAVVDGIPVTSLVRTLTDLANLGRAELERAVERAERLGLLEDLSESALASARGQSGIRLLREVLGAYDEPAFLRSKLERRFLGLCRERGLPAPSMNVWVEQFEVDALWSQQRLIVELDGREWHRTTAAFERDRARDAALMVAGYRVLRVTYRRLIDAPGEVMETVASLLGRSRAGGRRRTSPR